MKARKAKLSNPDRSEELLLAEIDALRQQLAEAETRNGLREERQQAFARILKLGFWEWDEIKNRPIAFSDVLAHIFGFDPAEFAKTFQCQEDFYRCIHPDDLVHYMEHTCSQSMVQDFSQDAHIFDYRIIHASGETRYVRELEFAQRNQAGEISSSFGLVHDVSEYHNTLAALSESEQRFSSLFAQMPLGVQEEDYSAIKKVIDKLLFKGVTDLKEYFLENPKLLREMVGGTRITNVNDALLQMHVAKSTKQFLAVEADIDGWWDAEWVEYYATEIAALASAKNRYDAERVDSRVDHAFIQTRTIVTIARGCEDTWERVITIHEDISDRKKVEVALIEAKTQAEKANLAKSEFLSTMSHELRTPLNAILGFSQLFEFDPGLDKQHIANAVEINRAGKHLMSLIDQILDLSRIEAGEVGVSMEPVSLEHVLNTSITWVIPMALNRGISLNFDAVTFKDIHVCADSIRLKQVFLNLLTNAIKYNRQGGSVSIGYEESEDGYIRVGIKDTGLGLSDEKREELFQPFNRLGAEFSLVEGTGIGLVITRQLVELMHGQLQVESEVDVGSTFWVGLKPVKKPPAPEALSHFELNSGELTLNNAESPRILVVEDNLVNQELMSAQLDILGYLADYAEDGVSALQQWQQQRYDLLLTDIRMPQMNGYDLVRQIRQLEVAGERRSTVIAITANALEADIKKCFDAGVDDVISKPVELEDLRQALEKWLPDDISAPQHQPDSLDINLDEAIDINVLQKSTGDKPELHQNLLQTFAAAMPEVIGDIQQAFAWKSHEQIAEHAHKLKSSASSMGALLMAEICQQLETAGRESNWTKIDQLVPQLLQQQSAVSAFYEAYMDTPVAQQAEADKQSEVEFFPDMPDDEDDVTEFSIRLLLVDDDYIMHRVTTVMLNDLGISSVVNAMSAAEALEIMQQNEARIDVVICDLNMPHMDGIEFIRQLAKQKYPGSIIVTSGEDIRILKTVEKLAIEHDMHVLGVLEKPVTPAKLSELLESMDQIRSEGTMMMADAFSLAELEKAITSDELDTYFQPKVDIISGRVVGVEALVRWNHPLKGLIKPNAFISMAEDNGLIGGLTDVVCNKALEYAAILKARGHELSMAINISVDALTDLEWPDKISALMQQSGLEASSISFEITESRLMEHISVALDILSRLSLKRFNLSIDDFGTGYSSMEQLQRIPFSELKIDRAFVHGASREASAQAILESSVMLAKKLGMTVVVEGVEDQADWDLVAASGCDQVQGYFVSRPLAFKQLLAWLDKRRN